MIVIIVNTRYFLWQSAGLPWTIAKGQDTFTPISSVVRIVLHFDVFLFVINDLFFKVHVL
jgi:hypothetical protein